MILLLAFASLGAAAPVPAAELRSATLSAWQDYVHGAEVCMQSRLNGKGPFLWIDESGGRARRVRAGETIVAPMLDQGLRSVPGGLIHHWIGVIFIPGATTESLQAVFTDYDRYSEIYKPMVADSKAISANGNHQVFSMTWFRRVLFVDAAIQAWFQSERVSVDSRRSYSVVDATRIQQIEHYRRPSERLLPPDTGFGFIWRVQAINRFEERDGGVYVEIEAMTLTRDIPTSLQWLVTPVVEKLSVNSLVATLEKTRKAVTTQSVAVVMSRRHPQ